MNDVPLPPPFHEAAPASFRPGSAASIATSVPADGYRGIWFALGFKFEFGDKYSGGLGTYTANHVPMAEYAPAVNKTFFTYGGTPSPDKRELAIMVSYYDHERQVVPRPVTLYLDPAVDDPHDNASLRLDEKGHVWVFKSGRNTSRPGIFFRSVKPHDLSAFERMAEPEVTYPQIWKGKDGGWFLLFTKYFPGTANGPERKLFWKTSPDGRTWSEDHLLAGFGGHYQTSGQGGGKIATFFNYHPDSNVDRRTNLYYAQTADEGKTWTTASGTRLTPPLTGRDNSALVLDLQSEGKFMYTCDLNFDRRGNPILLCIISRAGEPGPAGDPREWTVLHWTGTTWSRHVVAISDHNYDMGSLYVNDGQWRIIGPTGAGPQKWGAGGEMETWVSRDEGATWRKERALTTASDFNHSYARRPLHAHPDFAVFWADGNPQRLTKSHLYFANADGSRVFRLPYTMSESFARPGEIPPQE
ncbi:MAG: hypothetical protein K0R17_134 [Rariglobus sp.]|jgi:hypothetical protein|nr:hypothetical protein [Rariglobus sp.]